MSEDQNGPLIEGHDYDGIQELDNPLPTWWLLTFFATIIFSFIYWIHYDVSRSGPTTSEELAARMNKWNFKQQAQVGTAPAAENIDVAALLADPQALNEGKMEYTAKCAACHGNNGEGMIGPNLTDQFWIHEKGSFADILKMIKIGVPEKGMPPWDALISPDLQVKVAGYVLSLKGSNPERAKAPEGVEVKN